MERKPNKWSCVATAFANVIGKPTTFIWDVVGFDGSEIICNDLPEPYKRRGMTPFEISLALAPHGFHFLHQHRELTLSNKWLTGFARVSVAYNHHPYGVMILESGHAVSLVDNQLYCPDDLQLVNPDRIIEMYFWIR